MRTRKAWMEAIKDGEIKERILLNTRQAKWDNEFKKFKTLHEAHQSMFSWQESPEGQDYWLSINNDMENKPENFIKDYEAVKPARKTFDQFSDQFSLENIVKFAAPKATHDHVSLTLLETYITSDHYPKDFRKQVEDVINDFTHLVAQKIDILNSHAVDPDSNDALKFRRMCRSIAKSQKLELIELILKF